MSALPPKADMIQQIGFVFGDYFSPRSIGRSGLVFKAISIRHAPMHAHVSPRFSMQDAIVRAAKRRSRHLLRSVPVMAAPASSLMTRVVYGMTQLPRVAWYLGHALALRRLAEAARRNEHTKPRPIIWSGLFDRFEPLDVRAMMRAHFHRLLDARRQP